MSWKNRFTYASKHYVEHLVGENTLRFYPNRIGLLQELAEISKPIAKAISRLFSESGGDRTAITEKFSDRDGLQVEKITVEAMTPESASSAQQQKDAAIEDLLSALANPRNRLLVGQLLMDSLRDEFPYKKDRPIPEIEEFLYGDGESYQGLELPILANLIKGWMKANARVFGEAGERVAGIVQSRLGNLRSESTSEPMTPASGSSSKTQSSMPSDGVSESSLSSLSI